MRVFTSYEDMINETAREIFSRGQEVFDKTVQGKEVDFAEYKQKELIGYTFRVINPETPLDLYHNLGQMLSWANENFNRPHLNPAHGDKWFESMISGKMLNPDLGHEFFEDYWNKFGYEKDGKMSYSYAERMTGLEQVINSLAENIYRRGAIITIYNTPQDLCNMGKRRTPCSVSYQFLIRQQGFENRLTLLYTMRSADFVNFFPLDIYRAARLGGYIADRLIEKTGEKIRFHDLMYFGGSLHAYYIDVPEDRRW